MTRTLKPIATILLAIAALQTASYGITVNFTTDTENELIGSFSITGEGGDSFSPTNFQELPLHRGYLNLERYFNPDTGGVELWFGADSIGTPDDPKFYEPYSESHQIFAEMSGYYTNGGDTRDNKVYWRFWNFQDTGGHEGTFSGNFHFSRSPINAPDSGSTALLAIASLALLAAVRRKCAQE